MKKIIKFRLVYLNYLMIVQLININNNKKILNRNNNIYAKVVYLNSLLIAKLMNQLTNESLNYSCAEVIDYNIMFVSKPS